MNVVHIIHHVVFVHACMHEDNHAIIAKRILRKENQVVRILKSAVIIGCANTQNCLSEPS